MRARRHLFVLDPFPALHIERDTSVLVMNEALARGHHVFSCTEYDISQRNRRKRCRAVRHTGPIAPGFTGEELPREPMDLEEFDAIHIRKDPPFDESYIALLLILSGLAGPLLLNEPRALLEYNEKTTILLFPDYLTDTLVSSSFGEIEAFLGEVGGVAVLKPLFSCSGRGVHLLDRADSATKDVIREATAEQRRKVMVQRFLPQVREGETRIFMVEERPIAVMKKVPEEGGFKANFDFGARGIPYRLGPREEQLCRDVGAFFRREGIAFAALDVIDGHLSEVNITSPGLLVETNQVTGECGEAVVVDYLEERLP